MKKFFCLMTIGCGLWMSQSLFAAVNVSTFEEVQFARERVRVDAAWINTANDLTKTSTFASGDYEYEINVAQKGNRLSGFIVSNETNHPQYNRPDSLGLYQAAPGCAHTGNNYVTFYWDLLSGNNAIYWSDLEGELESVKGLYITNTAYVLDVMRNGGAGQTAFTSADWLKVRFKGWNFEESEQCTDSVVVYLAQDGEFITDWQFVDLSALGPVEQITFQMFSSRSNGPYGILTPPYFCMDDIGASQDWVAPKFEDNPYVEQPYNPSDPSDPMSVSDVTSPAHPEKRVEGGHLFIIRDGIRYGMLGK